MTAVAAGDIAVVRPPSNPYKTVGGIEGFDLLTGGGMPVGRRTTVIGGPGVGKAILARQTLLHG